MLRVAVLTCQGPLFLQEPLVWWSPTLHAWVEQNPLTAKRFLMAAWRVLVVRVCWLGEVWSRAVSLVPGEVDRSLRSACSLVMASYFLVVEMQGERWRR